MRLQQSTLHITLAASLLVMCVPAAAAQSAGACAEHPHCTEVPSFVAAVTDFRESTAGGYQVLSMTMRFRNKTARPLVLAYVSGSGLGTDDQGNRYPAAPGSLRGLGEVTPHAFDPKFVLQPGESGDARLEFNWQRGNQIRGTRYVLDLAVRELEPVAGNQWRLGREHALQFAGLGGPSAPLAGVPSGPAAPPAQPASGNPPPAAAADARAGPVAAPRDGS